MADGRAAIPVPIRMPLAHSSLVAVSRGHWRSLDASYGSGSARYDHIARSQENLCDERRRLADTAQLREVCPFAECICITAIRACLGAHDWGPGVQ